MNVSSTNELWFEITVVLEQSAHEYCEWVTRAAKSGWINDYYLFSVVT